MKLTYLTNLDDYFELLANFRSYVLRNKKDCEVVYESDNLFSHLSIYHIYNNAVKLQLEPDKNMGRLELLGSQGAIGDFRIKILSDITQVKLNSPISGIEKITDEEPVGLLASPYGEED